LRKVIAEDFAFDGCTIVRMLVLFGLCMNEDASSCSMIIICWFFVNISGICLGVCECRQESIGCIREEIRSLLFAVGITETRLGRGVPDRQVDCLVMHPLFWYQSWFRFDSFGTTCGGLANDDN
jgi:hypothetical protein